MEDARRPTFPEWLEDQIKKRRWTIRQAALYVKISHTSLRLYLKGERKPSRDNLQILADYFKIDWYELDAMVNPPEPKEALRIREGEDEEIQFVDLDKVPVGERDALRKAILALVKGFEER